jgi:hypothetical protein
LEDHDFEEEDIQSVEDEFASRKNFIVTRSE